MSKSIYFSKELLEKLEQLATEEERSLSQVVNRLIKKVIE